MYVPPLFAETDVPRLHEAIRAARLASLGTFGETGIEASHVPMLIDPEPAPWGTIYGHIARTNPQWQRFDAAVPALAIFLGPEAYVSPAWYPTKQQTGKVVPTWNYVAVHAYGPLRFFEDAESLLSIVTRLTERHEKDRPEPWRVDDAPADYIASMLKAIVGFALPIARLEGKWKMSQNRPHQDRLGVVEGLTREGGAAEATVAALVQAADQKSNSG